MTPHGCILGFDFGLRRIGVAVGQTLLGTATPITTLTSCNNAPDWTRISQLIREWSPAILIVGMPISADGTKTPLIIATQSFIHSLEQRYLLPVDAIDERLSSHEARFAAVRGAKRNPKIARDHIAAQVILQTWLIEHIENNADSWLRPRLAGDGIRGD